MSIKSRRGQAGFTLIEVMLALLVLSFGLLAVAAMQDIALGRNVDANELSIVTNLASDMAERIRFNRARVDAYTGIDTEDVNTRPPATEAQARGDYDQWAARLAATNLTNIRGRVQVVDIGPPGLEQSQVTVQITWSGANRTGTGVLRNRIVSLGTLITPE